MYDYEITMMALDWLHVIAKGSSRYFDKVTLHTEHLFPASVAFKRTWYVYDH